MSFELKWVGVGPPCRGQVAPQSTLPIIVVRNEVGVKPQ